MEEDKFKEGFLDLKINNYIDGFRNKYRNEYQCLKEWDSFFYRIQDELTKKLLLKIIHLLWLHYHNYKNHMIVAYCYLRGG